MIKDLNVTRAVHRLERERFVFFGDFRDKHILAIFIPMARLLPKFAVHQHRRLDFLITIFKLAAAHIVLQQAVKRPAMSMPKGLTLRLFLEVEQIKLTPKAAMVAFLGFFDLVQMRV